jgi:hypothetical protein
MEPIQPNFNDEYTTPVCSTEMVNPQQTHVRSIWRTPSGRDLYEKFNFSRPPFDPPTSVGAEAGPSGQTIDHPIEQIVNTSTTSVQVQSDTGIMLPSHVQSTLTITPTIPLQPTTPYIPQNPIGTPVHHRMQNPATHKINCGTNPDWGETPI